MSEGPVLAAASDFLRPRVDRDKSTARKRADVGTTLLVEREIPTRNRLTPVAESPGKGVPPFGPIGGVVRPRVIWAALRPMHLSIGVSVVDLGSHARAADISVP